MTNSSASLRLHELLRGGNKYYFKKGQVVQSSDGRLSLSLISKGYIKRYMIANDGSIGVHGIYGPDNFFPLTLTYQLLFTRANELYSGPEVFYYETMTESIIYTIENEVFIEKVKKDPLLYRGLLAESGRRLHAYIHQLENMSLKSSYKRVAHQIVYYAQEFGSKKPGNKIKINLPMTHQLLADILTLTRETVSQSIGQLRQNGLIDTSDNIVVLDIDKLDQFARS